MNTENNEKLTGDVLQNIVLTPEEEQKVREAASKICLEDASSVLSYGAPEQQKIADFSDNALRNVKAGDLGKTGEMIADLVVTLKENPAESRGFLGLFRKPATLEKIKAKYAVTEKNVEAISSELVSHQNLLTRDATMLDELYQVNLDYYKDLTMDILAGKQALEEARNGKLAQLNEKAQISGLPEDAQAAADYQEMITRFEKRLYDLELTRTVSMQMAPQIRLLQNNDMTMVEKIQSTIVNTIPLWKNQMVLALGLAHSEQALKAEKEVTDLTNDLLRQNAEKLKAGTVEIARESERGVVDIETLQETNQKLIDSLSEVTAIQEEGRRKRAEAELSLRQIEGELRTKLLELSTKQQAEKNGGEN